MSYLQIPKMTLPNGRPRCSERELAAEALLESATIQIHTAFNVGLVA